MGKSTKKSLRDLKNDNLGYLTNEDMTKVVGGAAEKGKMKWKGSCGGIVPQ